MARDGGEIQGRATAEEKMIEMKKIVLYEEETGIFLGEAFGLGFWTKLDPVGQTHACTFDSEEDAHDYVKLWRDQTRVNKIQYVEVDVSGSMPPLSQGIGASVEECVRAGLPAWDPDVK